MSSPHSFVPQTLTSRADLITLLDTALLVGAYRTHDSYR